MKSIDLSALSGIGHLDISSYLRSKGWRLVEDGDRASVWSLTTTAGDFEVLVPGNPTLSDYARRVAEAMDTLEVVEQRAATSIVKDLQHVGFDLSRIRPGTNGAGDIRYIDGAKLVNKAGEMFMAAACAAVNPKAVYPNRKPDGAIDYFNRLTLGQTELGSFVLTVLSPVPPSLAAAGRLDMNEDPFARKVTITLAKALKAVATASRKAAESGDYEAFADAVPDGVSANLCEAVCGIGEMGEGDVDVRFSWSPTRPVPNGIENTVRFSRDSIPFIGEAARLLRAKNPVEQAEIRGVVVKLFRPKAAALGKVGIYGIVDGRPRMVVCELSDNAYSIATKAHEARSEVVVVGTLEYQNRTLVVEHPTITMAAEQMQLPEDDETETLPTAVPPPPT